MTQDLNSFAKRLQSQLLLRGKPISPTLLAREFNLRWRGSPVSTNAARKWLYGPTLPKMEKIQVLAKMLGTSAEWLRWGPNTDLVVTGSARPKQPVDLNFTELQLAESVLHDWSLLTDANKKLISALLDFLLTQQHLHKIDSKNKT
jgi:hypothetical protein